MKKTALALRNEKKSRDLAKMSFSEELDKALCRAINKTALKYSKRLSPKQLDLVVIRTLAEQLYYAIHEERRL